jgi:hypothetical protein
MPLASSCCGCWLGARCRLTIWPAMSANLYSLDNDHVRQLVTDAVFNAEHAGQGIPHSPRPCPANV